MLSLNRDELQWIDKAECKKNDVPLYMFFDGFELKSRRDRAIFLSNNCDICEAKSACLEYAYKTEVHSGLHGGMYFVAGRDRNPMTIRFLEDERDRKGVLQGG